MSPILERRSALMYRVLSAVRLSSSDQSLIPVQFVMRSSVSDVKSFKPEVESRVLPEMSRYRMERSESNDLKKLPVRSQFMSVTDLREPWSKTWDTSLKVQSENAMLSILSRGLKTVKSVQLAPRQLILLSSRHFLRSPKLEMGLPSAESSLRFGRLPITSSDARRQESRLSVSMPQAGRVARPLSV